MRKSQGVSQESSGAVARLSAAGLGAVPLLALLLGTLLFGCSLDPACGRDRAKALSDSYGLSFRCGASECRAKLSPSDFHRLGDGMPSGGIEGCSDISSRPDARSSSAAMGDPCCHAGGSACTHFYHYVLSESAGELCVAL